MNIPVGYPKDGTNSKVLMKADEILAMTKSSFHHEEATTEQQGGTRKKKSIKKKEAAEPGAVLSKSAELSSKEYEDSAQQASSSKGKKSGDGTNDEPGVKKSIKKKKATEPGAVLSKSAESDSAQQASSSKCKKSGDGTNDEPGVKKSVKEKKVTKPGAVSSKSTELSSKEDEESAQQASSSKGKKKSGKAEPEADSGAIHVKDIAATHQDGIDLERGGSEMTATVGVEAAKESELASVEAQDGTVTATAVARDSLEQEIRDRLVAETVKAEVIKLGSSSTHKKRKWMKLGCILLMLVNVGIGVVLATGASGGGDAPSNPTGNSGGGNAPSNAPSNAPTTQKFTEGGPTTLDYLESQSPDGGVALSNLASP
jgi:hypothetical protein